MDGVKVTYIETRFVTSDAAGFKDLVQRLTGRSAAAATVDPAPAPAPAAPPPHRPRACRAAAAAAAGTQQGYGYHYHPSSPSAHEPRISSDGRLAPPCLDEATTYGVGDFAGLFYGGSGSASQNFAGLFYSGSPSPNAPLGHGGYYSDYFQC